jgi:hypothetical protein
MQWNYTGDTAGLPGTVSASSPRWLRLTRSGDTITGYDSADGSQWTTIGTATLAGLPSTAQAGLFVAAPQYLLPLRISPATVWAWLPTQATAVFDRVSLAGGHPAGRWNAGSVGRAIDSENKIQGRKIGMTDSLVRSGGAFSVRDYGGDISPYVTTSDPLGTVLKGIVLGMIAVIALGAVFITAEYRRGLIRTTLTATPRRGRVLAAKAVVIGAVTFVAGLLAVVAILALSAGTMLRRSAGAIAAVVALVVVPLILAVTLPQGAGLWALRLTPAAGFGVQQGIPHYSQVMSVCEPHNGCFPLAPWTGFAVSCAWAAAIFALAICAAPQGRITRVCGS